MPSSTAIQSPAWWQLPKTRRPPLDVKARLLADLAGYCHAKRRPETQRRQLALDAPTLEARGLAVLVAIGSGDLSPDEGAALLTGLARQGELEKLGVLGDMVAKLLADRGLPVPPELEVRRRIPATLDQGAAP